MSDRWIPMMERVPTESDGVVIIGYGAGDRLVLVRREDGGKAHLCRWDAYWFRSKEHHAWTHWLPLS